MQPCYAKTEAGREEIHHPTLKFSRAARNLLLVIDEKHPGVNWVQLVHGATEADLRDLLTTGLIELKKEAPGGLRLTSARTLAEALAHLSYDQLYNLMTSQARDRLGLVRGFRFVLTIERCADIEELRTLALHLMKLIHQHQGEAVARQFQLALGVTASALSQ